MRIEKRTNEVVDRVSACRGRLLPDGGGYFVHVMSRVVDQRFIFGDVEKAYFRRLMRAQAAFSGLQIVTYALMSNHFHILLEVPEPSDVSDRELYRRMELAQGKDAVAEFKQLIRRLETQGATGAAEVEKQKVKDRMYDLAAYMCQVKRLFTRWYNRRMERKGTLWEARYKSVVVEGTGRSLLAMASYIDLNAVRAKIVNDPKDYRFCGYGEAVAGSKVARAGLSLLHDAMGRSTEWRMVQRTYRKSIYAAGDRSKRSDGKQPFDREAVQQVWEDGGELTPFELMRCKIRYFSDGVALGSKEFVEELFTANRAHFSERRHCGARSAALGPIEELYTLRDLRVKVVT